MFAITAADIATCRQSGASPIEVAINRRLRKDFVSLVLPVFGISILERLADHVAGQCPVPPAVQAFARQFYVEGKGSPIQFQLPELSPWFFVR